MAGILNTNGAVISGTTVFFENFDVIRYSAAQALAAVSLRVTSGGFLDLSAELNFAPVNIVAFSAGSSLVTGSGNDTLTGGAGNDTLDGGAGIDVFRGGAGNDTYIVTNGDLFYENAGQGTDTVFCPVDFTLPVNFENVVMTGAAFAVTGNGSRNAITGTAGSNAISGLGGNDLLDGGGGNDTLDGGLGNDTLYASPGTSSYVGGAGIDTLDLTRGGFDWYGDISPVFGDVIGPGASFSSMVGFERFLFGSGADVFLGALSTSSITLVGGGGADELYAGNGDDLILGGDGDDSLGGGAGRDTLRGGAGNDRFYLSDASGIDVLEGGDGADQAVLGRSGFYNRITLNAAASIETVVGHASGIVPWYMSGSSGNDVFNLSGVTQFSQVSAVALGAGDDLYTGAIVAEAVVGGDGGDTLLGGTGNDLLYGYDAISFSRNDGSNLLNGQAGNDSLYGGSDGSDTFVFDTALNAASNVDQVFGFQVAPDTIRLDDAVFQGLAPGVLKAADFVIGGAAATTAQNIIYNATTGDLFYDPDGLGGAAQVRFAMLDARPALTIADFLIV